MNFCGQNHTEITLKPKERKVIGCILGVVILFWVEAILWKSPLKGLLRSTPQVSCSGLLNGLWHLETVEALLWSLGVSCPSLCSRIQIFSYDRGKDADGIQKEF